MRIFFREAIFLTRQRPWAHFGLINRNRYGFAYAESDTAYFLSSIAVRQWVTK